MPPTSGQDPTSGDVPQVVAAARAAAKLARQVTIPLGEVDLSLDDRLRAGLRNEPVVGTEQMYGDVGPLQVVANCVFHFSGVQWQVIVRQDDMATLA